jgi:hypothetical protein
MRGEHDIVHFQKRTILWQRLKLEDIQSRAGDEKVFTRFLYRTNVVARVFFPKQPPVLRDIFSKQEIAAPPKTKNGGSQRHKTYDVR